MRKIRLIIFTLIIIFSFVASCEKGNVVDKKEYEIHNIRIYENTPVWKLSRAVYSENTGLIEAIINNNPKLLNYQDTEYGATLLYWSIGKDKYKSTKKLLELGADPNIQTTYLIETPLFLASGYLWHDNSFNQDPKYIKLLLEYGADTEMPFVGYINSSKYNAGTATGKTALMETISKSLEKTKTLIDAGANINAKTDYNDTAVWYSMLSPENIEYAYLLIVVNKADVTVPVTSRDGTKIYSVNSLRKFIYDLDSKEYQMKMEIVEEFKHQGQDYWATEIRSDTLKKIKIIYPETWEEYIEVY